MEWHHLELARVRVAAPFSFALASLHRWRPAAHPTAAGSALNFSRFTECLQQAPHHLLPRTLPGRSRAREHASPVAHVAGGRRDPRAGRARGLRPHPQRVVVRDRVRRVRPGGTRHRSGFARRARRCCRVSRCVVAPRRRTCRRAGRGPRATVSSGITSSERRRPRAPRRVARAATPRLPRHLGLFSPRHPTSRSGRAKHAHIPPRSRLIAPLPPLPPRHAGYATDVATTSANSGAITAALKTPTADITCVSIASPLHPPTRARPPTPKISLPGAALVRTASVSPRRVCFSREIVQSPPRVVSKTEPSNVSPPFFETTLAGTTRVTTRSTPPATPRSARSRTSSSPAGGSFTRRRFASRC